MTNCRSTIFATLSFSVVLSPALAQVSHAPPSNTQLASPQIERKVDALLKQMTLDEKIGQLVQYSATEAHPRLPRQHNDRSQREPARARGSRQLRARAKGGTRLHAQHCWAGPCPTIFSTLPLTTRRLHIPAFGAGVVHGFRTIFPVPLATASSWDPALITDLAHMAGGEAHTAGVDWVYSPMVDIARDARWGRCTEGAGEDPTWVLLSLVPISAGMRERASRRQTPSLPRSSILPPTVLLRPAVSTTPRT